MQKSATRITAIVMLVVSIGTGAGVALAREQVLAKVNKATLTLREFNEMLTPPAGAQRPELTVEMKQRYMDSWVEQEIAYQEAIRQKIDRDEAVKRQLKQMTRQIIVQAFSAKKLESLQEPTQKELEQYYKDNAQMFQVPEQVTLAVIQLDTQEDAKAAGKRLEAGEDFAELAGELSTDKVTARRGGNLGPMSHEVLARRFSPECADAAFALEDNTASGPLRARKGYCILKSSGKLPAREQPFGMVKPRIQSMVNMDKRRTLFDSVIADLKKDARIEKHPELLGPAAADAPGAKGSGSR